MWTPSNRQQNKNGLKTKAITALSPSASWHLFIIRVVEGALHQHQQICAVMLETERIADSKLPTLYRNTSSCLCDRLSGAGKKHFKQTCSINKSLTCLQRHATMGHAVNSLIACHAGSECNKLSGGRGEHTRQACSISMSGWSQRTSQWALLWGH